MSVKRLPIIGLLAAAVVAASLIAAASSLAGAAATTSVAKAQLRGFVCQTARDPANRGVVITAVMRPLSHTQRLSLRFDLLVGAHRHGSTSMVHFGDLGTWIYPSNRTLGRRPGDVWIVHHPVAQLQKAPAYYRFKVSFRWLGAHSHVLGTAVRYSPTCFQPELRPDLQVAAIQVAAQYATHDLYKVLIRNVGASATDQTVEVAITGRPKPKTIAALGPHSKRWIALPGPLCNPTAPPTVTVDPSGVIDEFNYSNNSLTATCPAG